MALNISMLVSLLDPFSPPSDALIGTTGPLASFLEALPEVSSVDVNQTVEAAITSSSRLVFRASAQSRNGIGDGSVMTQYTRRDGHHETSVRPLETHFLILCAC